MTGRETTHGFVSQTSNACRCGLMLADCEVASRDAYTSGRETTVEGREQWRPLTVYTFHCAGCDAALWEAEFQATAWFSGDRPITAYGTLDEAGWGEVEGRWHCPQCFHTCWDADELPRLGRDTACAVCRQAREAEHVG